MTLSTKDKATRATEALYQLRREEAANGNDNIADVIDVYLSDAPTASRARLYDLVCASVTPMAAMMP